MKKTLKSLISLLTVAMMLLAFAPAGMAAPPATLDASATATLFGEGASTTATVTVDALLTDEYFYMAKDVGYAGVGVSSNLDKVVAFTKVDSGIEWSFDATLIKRLDIWMLNCGGIGDYQVTALVNGNETVVASGNLDKNDAAAVSTTDNSTASYYPIVFENGVETTKLKFIIKSFSEEDNQTAYISEAKVYNHNNIDFSGEYYSSTSRLLSPYLVGFQTGNRTSGTYAQEASTYTAGNGGRIWSGSGTGSSRYKLIDDGTNGIWYATGFNHSKVKVNKIGLTLSRGTIREFEVWVAEDNSEANFVENYHKTNGYVLTKYSNRGWRKLTTVKCNITPDTDDYTFAIPNAVEANSYMILATDFDEYVSGDETTGTMIEYVNMYSVADNELPSEVYSQGISGTVDAGQTITLDMGTNNLTNANAKVFFALYSGTELKNVTPVARPVEGSNFYTVDYQIPADAGDNLSVKAFVWDGTTLKPLLNTPATKAEVTAE